MAISPTGGGTQGPGFQNQSDIAKKAKQAVSKGINDGGQVTPVKRTSDESGANGNNDYFSALGYDG
jgi:hypothetical protein